MRLNLRNALRALLDNEETTEEQLRVELDNLKTQQLLDDLRAAGHLPADDATAEIARKFARSDPDGLRALLSASRPTPAATTTFTPPTAPRDETEDAIQAHMKQNNCNYATAAAAVVTALDTGA